MATRTHTYSELDDEQWDSIVCRNPLADGIFFYSVRTTGIYCKPSCPSRTPRRDNVQAHASCEAADRAGFRPCKRCRPQDASLLERQTETIVRACRAILESGEPQDLETLATSSGMSRFHFHRVFKRITGLTPKAFARSCRTQRIHAGLPKDKTITDTLYEAGYNSNGRFYADAPAMLGMTPSAFRSGGKGEVIRFAAGQCSLGGILVAATEKGICSILLGDDADALVRDLQDRFPRANLIGGDRDFEGLVALVVGFVESPRLGLQLPLDIRGTAFQQRVWQALRRIPCGKTSSYLEIAKVSACLAGRGPWREHAPQTASPLPFLVTVLCGQMEHSQVTDGECSASGLSSIANARNQQGSATRIPTGRREFPISRAKLALISFHSSNQLSETIQKLLN